MLSSVLHFCLGITLASYLFVARTRNLFDFFYVFGIYAMFLHWTFLNGECIVSYLAKKKDTPNYVAGQNSFKHDFFAEFDFFPPILLKIYGFMTFCLILYNVVVVSIRNYVPIWIAMAFIGLNLLYYTGSYLFKNLHKNRRFHFFQDIIKYGLIIWAFLFLAYFRFA